MAFFFFFLHVFVFPSVILALLVVLLSPKS